MTPAQFRDRLRADGPALERWPDAEQARQLLATSARARRRFLAALSEDASLDAPLDPALLARLAARTRADIARTPRAARPRSPLVVSLQWGALAACAALGLWAGTPGPRRASPTVPTVLASMQITAFDPPWDAGR